MVVEPHNYVTLRDHFDSRIAAIEKSIETTSRILDRRLDGMNEFREALKDQALKFITRTELEATLKGMESDIRALREYKAEMGGKASRSAVWFSYAIGSLGVILGAIHLFK